MPTWVLHGNGENRDISEFFSNLGNSLQIVRSLRLRFLYYSLLVDSFLMFYLACSRHSVNIYWLNYWMTKELTFDCNATCLFTFHEWVTFLYPISIQPCPILSWPPLFYIFKVAFKRPHKNQWKIKNPGQEFQGSKGSSICKEIVASGICCIICGIFMIRYIKSKIKCISSK